MAANECRVYFALNGSEFDPADITSLLGVVPTTTKKKGEKIPGRLPKYSSWQLSTADIKAETIDVYSLASEISNILAAKTHKILEAIKVYDVSPRLQVVLSISTNEEESTPAIGFEVETIKFLSDIGCFIDIDTYKHES